MLTIPAYYMPSIVQSTLFNYHNTAGHEWQYCLPFTDEETGTEKLSLAKGHRADEWQGWTLTLCLHHPNPRAQRLALVLSLE